MIKLNSDKILVDEIDRKLKENKEKYGRPYCPCSIEHNEDTVCMCKEFRDMKQGECHCGKFIKE